jgi:RNA recognition motif-containing protein
MNLFISNISLHTTVEDLKTMFSKFGEIISAKIIMNKETNRHRGFGFVEMTTREQGEAAMKALHNREIEGRLLSVAPAKMKSSSTYPSFGNRRVW